MSQRRSFKRAVTRIEILWITRTTYSEIRLKRSKQGLRLNDELMLVVQWAARHGLRPTSCWCVLKSRGSAQNQWVHTFGRSKPSNDKRSRERIFISARNTARLFRT